MKKRKAGPAPSMVFVNRYVQDNYQVRPGQQDVKIRIPALNWISYLSRITPRVAEQLVKQRSGLISRKVHGS